MAKPNVTVITGYGINCDDETRYFFERAGACARIAHINQVIIDRARLKESQILVFPGGFSDGDDTGSGKVFATRIKAGMWEEMLDYISGDRLAIGICNGFQVMTSLGLLPAFDGEYGKRTVALTDNDNARYTDRWVDIKFTGKSPWVQGMDVVSMPIAHAEGKFYASNEVLDRLEREGHVMARYVRGPICEHLGFEANPNGSLNDIAGIIDATGRVAGLMPHPERGSLFEHRPDWRIIKRDLGWKAEDMRRGQIAYIDGFSMFRNGVNYFK